MSMVVRTRLRSALLSFLLLVLCGTGSYYFVWSAANGGRGLKTQAEFEAKTAELNAQLTKVKAERVAWEHRIALMRSDSVDKDLLEEEVRLILDRVHKNDVVIFVKK